MLSFSRPTSVASKGGDPVGGRSASVVGALDAAPRARVGLLGGFRLSCGHTEVTTPRNVQRVIALLALHDRPLLRSYVAGMLWLELSEQRALASLRSALWRVRQVDAGLVTAQAGQLCLAADVAVDTRAMVRGARRLIDLDDPGVEKLVGEADLADDLLPDWYEDWVVLERERLRQLRLHGLESLTRRLYRAGRYAEAVQAGMAAVKCEPLRESAHRTLIDVYMANGNFGEALRQYHFYADLLARELGLEPSPTIQSQVGGFIAR